MTKISLEDYTSFIRDLEEFVDRLYIYRNQSNFPAWIKQFEQIRAQILDVLGKDGYEELVGKLPTHNLCEALIFCPEPSFLVREIISICRQHIDLSVGDIPQPKTTT